MQHFDETTMSEDSDSLTSEDELRLTPLSWDSEHSIKFLEQNANAFQRSVTSISNFFDNISGPRKDSRDTHCPSCLDLNWNLYDIDSEDYSYIYLERMHSVRFHELRTSGRRGCETCCILFNGIAHFCGIDSNRSYMVEMILGDVYITLRDGHVPLVTLNDGELHFKSPFAQIEFFSLNRSDSIPWPAIKSLASIPKRLDLGHCLSFVRPLLESCAQSHQTPCLQTDFKKLPKRFLDVGSNDPSSSVKLITTEDIKEKVSLKYIALSHCWGEASNLFQTTKQNIKQQFHSIPWRELSKTFKDAIYITRGLGVRYLWIDSICIIQDENSDWISEATIMADIYSNSYLTIAATGSADSSGGCLFSRWLSLEWRVARHQFLVLSETREGVPCEVYARNTDGAAHRQLTNDTSQHRITAPLLSRAWCFQEHILSRRVLHFHSEEMIWECGSSVKCECGYFKSSVDSDLASSEAKSCKLQTLQALRGLKTKSEVFNTWLEVVKQYSGLLLTKETDRLVALAGLAQRFQEVLGCQYWDGLWDEDIPRALLWEPTSSTRRRVTGSAGTTIPTWSWASIEHIDRDVNSGNWGVRYLDILELDIDNRVKVINISSSEIGGNRFLTGSGASIFIQGACISTTILESVEGLKVDLDVTGEMPTEKVTCLLLGTASGIYSPGWLHFLILQESPLGQSDRFERIGRGCLDPRIRDWFKDVAPREIEII